MADMAYRKFVSFTQKAQYVEDLSRYAGLIFDCDGTLTDSMPLHYESWVEAMDRCGIEFPEDRFYSMGGMKTEKIVEVLAREQAVEVDIARAAREKEEAFLARVDRLGPREDVCDIARKWHGRIPMAVASGSERASVKSQLDHIGMSKYFSVIVAAEDTRRHKPQPDVFLKAAELLEVAPSQCLVYEDSPLGIEAAMAASMDCVDVRDFSFVRYCDA